MATLLSNHFQSKNLLDTFYIKILGRRNGIMLSKLIHLVRENENVRISVDHLINSVGGAWKDRSVKASTKDLKDLDLIDKKQGYVRDAQGRIIASYIDFTMKWENIRKLVSPDGPPSTEGQNSPVPTVTFLPKELANKDLAISKKVISQKNTGLMPIENFPIEENIQVIKTQLIIDGIECDSVEHEMKRMVDNYSNPIKSRIASGLQKVGQKFMVCLKGFYSLFKRWIINGKINNSQELISIRLNNKIEKEKEEMARKEKEAVDPYKIESEMRYSIYNEKSETIKDLKFKILELATPVTYKAWFKDIIFETCFNDDNYDYSFTPKTNFLKDQFDTDPKLNNILKAFKIKIAA
jgi:hypothetical protein